MENTSHKLTPSDPKPQWDAVGDGGTRIDGRGPAVVPPPDGAVPEGSAHAAASASDVSAGHLREEAPSVGTQQAALEAQIRAAFVRQHAGVAKRRLTFGLAERRAALSRLREALITEEKAILAALKADFGKPEAETLLTELLPLRQDIKHAIRHLPRWMRDRRLGPTLATFGSKARIRRELRGVCLIIAPWNYPLNLALSPLVSCLAAGNSAIVKPSELAPATSALIARLLGACFPPDLVHVVEGGVEVSTVLLAQPFDHIFFTGSPAVGKIVMAAAAKHLTSVTLELGGKSPVVVGPEADVEQAADWIAFGKFANAGQTCIAPDHVFVHESLIESFRAALLARIAKAYGTSDSPHLARIISPRHAQRLCEMLAQAEKGGATLYRPGQVATDASVHAGSVAIRDAAPQAGFDTRVAPHLVEGLTPDMALSQEEIFGPILPIIAFSDLDRVIDQINQGPKPLALYVFDRRKAFADQVIAATSSGGVAVNATLLHYTHHGLPFGGVNHSGIGQAHGEWGFRAFSHERAILETRFSAVKLLFPPYTAGKLRLAKLVTRLLG